MVKERLVFCRAEDREMWKEVLWGCFVAMFSSQVCNSYRTNMNRLYLRLKKPACLFLNHRVWSWGVDFMMKFGGNSSVLDWDWCWSINPVCFLSWAERHLSTFWHGRWGVSEATEEPEPALWSFIVITQLIPLLPWWRLPSFISLQSWWRINYNIAYLLLFLEKQLVWMYLFLF